MSIGEVLDTVKYGVLVYHTSNESGGTIWLATSWDTPYTGSTWNLSSTSVRFVRASQLRAHLFLLSAEGIGKKYGNCSLFYMWDIRGALRFQGMLIPQLSEETLVTIKIRDSLYFSATL